MISLLPLLLHRLTEKAGYIHSLLSFPPKSGMVLLNQIVANEIGRKL